MLSFSYEPVEDRLMMITCDAAAVEVWSLTRRLVLRLVAEMLKTRIPDEMGTAAVVQQDKGSSGKQQQVALPEGEMPVEQQHDSSKPLFVNSIQYGQTKTGDRMQLTFISLCKKSVTLGMNRDDNRKLAETLVAFCRKGGWLSVPLEFEQDAAAMKRDMLKSAAEKVAGSIPTAS